MFQHFSYSAFTLAYSQGADPQIDIPAGQQSLLSACVHPLTRLVYPLIALDLDCHNFQRDGVGMFIRKVLFSFTTKDWYISFSCAYTPVANHSQRIFTESNINDRQKEQDLLCCAAKLIQQAIETHGVTLDEFTEIVLNVDDSRHWHYYFVDHTNRLLFWVQSVDVNKLSIDLQGITEYSHISMFDAPQLSSTDIHLGYMVEAHYWYASPASLSSMSPLIAFYSGTDPNSSISQITWHRGRIVNTTPTIVSFQNKPSKT